ncbi:MAG: hypothetical protein E6J45_11710 [Chloroflexi bacterium]|nr:MAG: hypothetical protein E6J45_11710 [Chloroflexota bacterium]
MAHHRAGRSADAQQWLKRGLERINTQVPHAGVDDLESPENYLVCQILRREAVALIGEGAK